MYRLYQMQDSGNCYKLRLLMHQLKIECQCIDIDILKGESRAPDFLKKNPNGRVPLLELDENTWLPESNAILWFLAEGSGLAPHSRLGRSQALQWMFFEQYSHEPFIATSRFWISILKAPEEYTSEIKAKRAGGLAALGVMENHLGKYDFFVEGEYSIADIALYAYTHVADEGHFELTDFPAIRRWLQRVAGQPGHIDIDQRFPDSKG